jgi:cobalt-zinc-cadmium efflux system outer membrane protein
MNSFRSTLGRLSLLVVLLVAMSAQAADAFEGQKTLRQDQLVAAVLKANPDLQSAAHAWRKVSAGYAQAVALKDPIVSYSSAPATLGSEHGYGQSLSYKQRFEWYGKQQLRGAFVRAQADGEGARFETLRQRLIELSSNLFADHYALARALEINGEQAALTQRLVDSSKAQYASGSGSQQAPLQALIALATLGREELHLKSRQALVIARLNGLLRRPSAADVPAPPKTLPLGPPPLESETLGLDTHPELRAIQARVAASRRHLELAQKNGRPDFSVGATYNSMWPKTEHQFMLGLSLNLPLWRDAKRGEIAQAEAGLAQSLSELAAKQTGLDVALRSADLEFTAALADSGLIHDSLLPLARAKVSVARAGFESARQPYSVLVMAQISLLKLRREEHDSIAESWRCRAALLRALGGVSNLPDSGEKK